MRTPVRSISLTMAACALALAAAFVEPAGAGGPDDAHQLWNWPTDGPVPVVRSFDPPEQPWLSGHRGVDLDVAVGATVRAPAEGIVVQAGTVVDRGVVSLQHGQVRSTFEPVDPLVSAGEHVSRGQAIATVAAGHSPGALHWGARIGRERYVDPLRMLVSRVVLKPWEG
jgi:murein DD-endopeptidase MepM/ murein hydrolase activator NlpD